MTGRGEAFMWGVVVGVVLTLVAVWNVSVPGFAP